MNRVVLGDIAEIITGPFGSMLHKSDYVEEGFPLVMPQDIGDRIINFDSIAKISEIDAIRLEKYEAVENDIIYARRGDVEKHAFVVSEYGKIFCGTGCLRVRVNPEKANPLFISFYLSRPESREWISKHAVGSNMPNINTEILSDVPIELPDKAQQQKVVDFLSASERKILHNRKINNNLEQQAVAVFNKFYDTSTNQQPFTTLINVLGGGTPKTGNPEFWDGSIPFFTPKDVGTPYTFKTEKYITESGLKHCNSRLYPQNTTFVTARGTVGKISLAGSPMAMNQSCYALASDIVDPLLVYFYVLKAVTSLKCKASGAVFDAIVTRDFDDEMINILSDTDSESALSIIKPMMEAIHNNSKENMRLSAVRDALLPKLISGESMFPHWTFKPLNYCLLPYCF